MSILGFLLAPSDVLQDFVSVAVNRLVRWQDVYVSFKSGCGPNLVTTIDSLPARTRNWNEFFPPAIATVTAKGRAGSWGGY